MLVGCLLWGRSTNSPVSSLGHKSSVIAPLITLIYLSPCRYYCLPASINLRLLLLAVFQHFHVICCGKLLWFKYERSWLEKCYKMLHESNCDALWYRRHPQPKRIPYHYYKPRGPDECVTYLQNERGRRGNHHRFITEKQVFSRWAKLYNISFVHPTWWEMDSKKAARLNPGDPIWRPAQVSA